MKKGSLTFLLITLLILPIIAVTVQYNNSNPNTPYDTQSNIFRTESERLSDSPEIPLPINENWTRLFGGSQEEQAPTLIQCSDGGFAFVGQTSSTGMGGADAWFVKTDSGGNTIWEKTYGGPGDDYFVSFVECSNGDFAFIGFTSSFGPGDRSVWLFRTDSNGNHLWNQTYGGTLEDVGRDIFECSNGDFLIAAFTLSFGAGDYDCWYLRTDSVGNHLWNHTFGGAGLDRLWSVREVGTGGFILSGECEINQVGNRDMLLLKTDSAGVIEWNATFGGHGRDRGVTALEYDGGYALFGTLNYTTGLGDSQYWLIVTNSTGDMIWEQLYGGSSIERASNMIVTSDNGFALFGNSYSFGGANGDFWLVRTDSSGDVLDTYLKGGSLNDYGRDVVQCPNGDFALVGVTYSYGAGDWDAWLIRVSDVMFEWNPTPSDRFTYEDQSFAYDLDATPEAWIDSWEINDTIHFTIDSQGLITNVTVLAIGSYGIHVRVNSTSGDLLEASFTVTVFAAPVYDDWTILVYLDGDNDLEEYAFNDLNSMETIGSTADVNILVYVDFWYGADAPYSGARCYEITQDANMNVISSTELAAGLPSEPNMGDWQVLRDFIVFSQFYAPAYHYSLVLWDHGAGAFGLCTDDSSNDRLSIPELYQALNDPQVQHLDLVAFDACLMGQLEVAYEIRNTTDLVVFSEESVPLTGFPYEDILLNLTTYPETTPKALASSMVYYYVTAYDVGGIYYDPMYNDMCLSAVETAYLSSVALSLDQLAQNLGGSVTDADLYEVISLARADSQGFAWADFIDLYSFASNLEMAFAGTSWPHSLALNLYEAVDDAVYEEMHLAGLPGAHGLGAVFGTYGTYQLALADDTEWDEFMDAFIDVGSTLGEAIPLIENVGYLGSPTLHCGYLDGPYDSVYFVFTAQETGVYTFTMDAAWSQYVSDFDLYVYNDYGSELAESISSTSSESISIYLSAGNSYYVEAYSYDSGYGGIGVFYLNIYAPSGPGPGPFPIIPPIVLIFIGISIIFAIVGGVIVATYYFQRRPSTLPPPPRPKYTSPARTPPTTREAQDPAKFCAYCGALVPYGARYCPVCGASLI